MARSQGLSIADPWRLVETAFDRVCAAYNARKFTPLLEADVAGYIYHALVTALDGDASRVHLDTRLLGHAGNEKYDLVIGKCAGTEEQKRPFLNWVGDNIGEARKKALALKSMLAEFRPAVRGELILELKLFAVGFTPPQLSGCLKEGIGDMRKLEALASSCPEGRGLVLFDDHGYLTPPRQQEILGARSNEDLKLRFYLFKRNGADELAWDLLRVPGNLSVDR